MLAQRCTLDQHRLIVPTSITKPVFEGSSFHSSFGQSHYRALVDTGAQRTVLSKTVIQDQKLVRIGHMEFSGLHGSQTHSRYLAQIGLWIRRINRAEDSRQFDQAELSLYNLDGVFEVVDMRGNENFDLILGFDVLKLASFSFDRSSQVFELNL